MASDDDTLDLHKEFERALENMDKLRRHLEARDKLDRVLGGFLLRVGKGLLDPDDAAMRLQAAMEDRLAVVPVVDRSADPLDDHVDRRTQRITDAQRAVQLGDLAGAITMYEALAQAYPEDTRHLLRLGDCCARTGNIAKATATYLAVARQYDAQGFFLKAIAVYKQVLRLHGHSPRDATEARPPNPLVADVFHALAGLYERTHLLSDALLALEGFLTYAEGTDERIASVRERLEKLQRS